MAELLLTTSSAARLAERSESCIRLWAIEGLLPFRLTPTGLRLFDAADVRRVARQRRGGRARDCDSPSAA
jgi:DNA-binding transcriptional MerR regulator